jgi:hypothetical protein
MRYLFMLLWIASSVMAQDFPENWATARLICQTETAYRIEVEAYGAADTVIIGLDTEDAITWNVGDEKTARFDVSLANSTLSLTVYAWGGAFHADSLVLGETRSCENALESDYDFVLGALRDVSTLIEGMR